MSLLELVNLCDCEDEVQEALGPSFLANSVHKVRDSQSSINHGTFEFYGKEEKFRDNGIPNGLPYNSLLDLSSSSPDSSCHVSALPSLVPLCRQFWRAGEYDAVVAPRPSSKTVQNRMRVHPKFLHSNATSHKWAFSAIAELLDNAVDEAQKGASFVAVDKLTNNKCGHALLIQDDGGGMLPESLRHCLSFGFSDKSSNSSIGQYGNGFKTSTMRLGADAIVFTRCCKESWTVTQSVGLLSYTFLRKTGRDDVIVPMVDYKFDTVGGNFVRIIRHSQKEFHNNLSTLLRWSPFAKEEDLLKQFDHIGDHGTRVLVFNMWLNDDGYPELDFDTNEQDITISGTLNAMHNTRFAKDLNENHVGNQFRYSLRAYSSILYLHLPERFKIFLRGCLVDPHYIAGDLMFTQCIKYKPQAAIAVESKEIGTVIGFLHGAPKLDIHGFNIYHRNRLILPFWRVAHQCKGVVGVLEVDCIKPTHDKQDFEKSEFFQKLVIRLKEMAWEYWKYHCHLIGYNAITNPSTSKLPAGYQSYQSDLARNAVEYCSRSKKRRHDVSANSQQWPGIVELSVSQSSSSTIVSEKDYSKCCGYSQAEVPRKRNYDMDAREEMKQQVLTGRISGWHRTKPISQIQHGGGRKQKQMLITMVKRRQELNSLCMELEKSVEDLVFKELKLQSELQLIQNECNGLYAELKSLDVVKMDKL